MNNQADQALLLTGASGFLAGELLPRLLKTYPDHLLYVLLRAESEPQLQERLNQILDWNSITEADRARCIALRGDVEAADLGLGERYDLVASRTKEIFHSAANTSFHQKLEQARQINYNGTVNVVALARRAAELNGFRRLHHVSTAYVCGNRSGLILERELECGQDFSNTYEQSKYESEIFLREQMSSLPITVYRPSIIVGDSRTGRTQHFYVIYEPMRWVYQGQMSFLPCKPETRLDIVPVDYVADALLAIGGRDDSAGKTYHLTAGLERSLNLRDIVEQCMAAMNSYNIARGRKELPSPEIITPETANSFEGEERQQFKVFFDRAWQQMQRHMPYVVSEKAFDDTNTQEALAGTGIVCPPFSAYLTAVVHYGMSREFKA